jgi:hypothetical protein
MKKPVIIKRAGFNPDAFEAIRGTERKVQVIMSM